MAVHENETAIVDVVAWYPLAIFPAWVYVHVRCPHSIRYAELRDQVRHTDKGARYWQQERGERARGGRHVFIRSGCQHQRVSITFYLRES